MGFSVNSYYKITVLGKKKKHYHKTASSIYFILNNIIDNNGHDNFMSHFVGLHLGN